jgi:radical SAM protein with 4Fe4S-binding SPASM domain
MNNTKRISFELSNYCNLSHIHKKCPISLQKEPNYLPLKIINNVSEYIKQIGWTGIIAFHTYNEPTIDPRLFMLIEKFNTHYILIATNGKTLNQQLLDELIEYKINEMNVTAYSNEDYVRLINLNPHNIKYSVTTGELDDRIKLYDEGEKNNNKICNAPLEEIIIGCNGDFCLCCLDWKKQHSFGNLNNQSFEDILKSEEIKSVSENLKKGNRTLDLCKRCDWTR